MTTKAKRPFWVQEIVPASQVADRANHWHNAAYKLLDFKPLGQVSGEFLLLFFDWQGSVERQHQETLTIIANQPQQSTAGKRHGN